MTIRKLHPALVVVFLVVLGACGSENGSTGISDPLSPGSDQQADSVSGQDLGDFPIPGPGVGSAALTSDSEELRAYTITFPAEDYEAIIAFYDDWTSSQTDDYQRLEAEAGGVSWTLVSGEPGHNRIIAASPGLPGEELGFVTLADGRSG